MKRPILTLSIIAVLAGCSSTPSTDAQQADVIQDQRLVSTFARNNIKLEWSCKWFTGITDRTCVKGNITAIEATGYAPSYGNTEVLRETAFSVAHDVALDKMVRFIKQDLTSSRVTRTLTKNVEKANDLIKTNSVNNAEVSDEDALTGSGGSTDTNRANVNETVRSVVENIRSQASGIVRGSQVIDEQVVDKKTVSVTVRWSIQTADQSKSLNKYFR